MPNDISMSTATTAQMANLVMLLAGAQGLPAKPKPSFAINDPLGHVEIKLTLLTEHQFPVVFLQYLLTIPEYLREATIKANSENIDRLSGGALDSIKELLGNSSIATFRLFDPTGHMNPSFEALYTETDFTLAFLQYFSLFRGELLPSVVIEANRATLDRFPQDTQDTLINLLECIDIYGMVRLGQVIVTAN